MPEDPLNMQLTQVPMQPTGGAIGSVLGMIANYHAAKENQATRDIQKMNAAMQAGFHPDPKAYAKAWKNAGVPLVSGKDADALVKQGNGNQGGQQPTGDPKVKPGDRVDVQDPHAQAYNVKSIVDVKDRQKKEMELGVDGVIRQAVMNAHLKGANEQAVMEQTQKMLELKTASLKGDMNAYGTLLRHGEVKLDVPANVFNAMTDTQKAAMGATMAGYESPEQKVQRISNGAHAMLSEGRFTNLEDATKYAQALDTGAPIPPELAAKAIEHPLNDMVKALDAIDTGAKMGMSGDQLASFGNKFSKIGLAALPTGMQSIYQEQTKIRKQEANAATTEAGAAASRAATERSQVQGFDRQGQKGPEHIQGTLESAMTEQSVQRREQDVQLAKINTVMHSTEDKEFLAGFAQTMINYRTKGNVPESVVNSYMDELVKRSGGVVTKEQVKGWFSTKVKSSYSWPTNDDASSSTNDTPGAP